MQSCLNTWAVYWSPAAPPLTVIFIVYQKPVNGLARVRWAREAGEARSRKRFNSSFFHFSPKQLWRGSHAKSWQVHNWVIAIVKKDLQGSYLRSVTQKDLETCFRWILQISSFLALRELLSLDCLRLTGMHCSSPSNSLCEGFMNGLAKRGQ